jgi:hypothetical protein
LAFSLPFISPPDILLSTAVLWVVLAWLLENRSGGMRRVGLKGNIAFSVLIFFGLGWKPVTDIFVSVPGFLFLSLLHYCCPSFPGLCGFIWAENKKAVKIQGNDFI